MSKVKNLYILRHAKSAWDEPGKRDRDRPLTIRGIKDIQLLGEALRDDLSSIEQIVTSHANRAVHTAILIATAINLPLHCIRITHRLYEADEAQVLQVVNGLPNDLSHVMIVGHNPTFSVLASNLIASFSEDIPTSGLVRVRFGAESWEGIDSNCMEWSAFDYPKKYK